MSEIELNPEQVEHFMQDLAKLSDESFGVIICRIYAARMEADGGRCYEPVKPIEIKPEVKNGKKSR